MTPDGRAGQGQGLAAGAALGSGRCTLPSTPAHGLVRSTRASSGSMRSLNLVRAQGPAVEVPLPHTVEGSLPTHFREKAEWPSPSGATHCCTCQ